MTTNELHLMSDAELRQLRDDLKRVIAQRDRYFPLQDDDPDPIGELLTDVEKEIARRA